MSEPKFLKNAKTGAVFPFHPLLAANRDMEPFEGEPASLIDNAQAGAFTEGGIIVEKASKETLLDFAAAEYGAQIDPTLNIKAIRAQVRSLIENEAND